MRLNARGISGITGIEIIALSFLGSMLASFFVGAVVGWEIRKAAKSLGLVKYQQIEEALGYGDVYPG